MRLKNSFEGGVHNQPITEANSGGASGDAFDYIIDDDGELVYSTTRAAHGSMSVRASGFVALAWDALSGNGDRWVRAYLWIPPDPFGVLASLMLDAESAGWSADVFVGWDDDEFVAVVSLGHFDYETDEDTEVATVAAAPALGQWIRVELRANNAANGSAEVRLFNDLDSTTPSGTASGTATQTASPWDLGGIIVQTGDQVWVDDMAVTDEGWLGPAVGLATPEPVVGLAVVPAPALSLGRTVAPDAITGQAQIPSPTIHTGSLTTPVNPQPATGVAAVPMPDVETHSNALVHPAPVVGMATIPFPDIGVPINPGDRITRAGQIEWNGFLLGSATPYKWKTLEGWVTELPSLDSGNVPQPSRHGAYPGRDLAQERHVIYTASVRPDRRENMQAVIDDLIAATRVLEDDTELPLAVRILGTTYVGYGKIARRAIPVDQLLRVGVGQLTIQWTLSDPLLQSRELASAVLQDGAWQDVTNLGNAPAYPEIRITGPCTDPTLIVRHDQGGRVDERVLEFSIQLFAGTLMVVDTYYGTAMIDDEPVMFTLSGSSVPIPDLVLPAGQSQVGYATANGGAPSATMLWRHSYL